MHFYELKKLPPLNNTDRGKELWLKLFNAETEEELAKIKEMGVTVMGKAIEAYRHVAASPEYRELERMRSKARHDEAQALMNARRQEEKKWQGIVADKDTTIAEKDTALAEQAALIAELRARLGEQL
jgi:hypothetical protein